MLSHVLNHGVHHPRWWIAFRCVCLRRHYYHLGPSPKRTPCLIMIEPKPPAQPHPINPAQGLFGYSQYTWIGWDWKKLWRSLSCLGFKPIQSRSIHMDWELTEQALICSSPDPPAPAPRENACGGASPRLLDRPWRTDPLPLVLDLLRWIVDLEWLK
jgi:hypothetical protein